MASSAPKTLVLAQAGSIEVQTQAVRVCAFVFDVLIRFLPAG